jgi:hypothetical protein
MRQVQMNENSEFQLWRCRNSDGQSPDYQRGGLGSVPGQVMLDKVTLEQVFSKYFGSLRQFSLRQLFRIR